MSVTLLGVEETIREIEWGVPETGWGWAGLVLVTGLVLAFVVGCYLRDTRDMSRV